VSRVSDFNEPSETLLAVMNLQVLSIPFVRAVFPSYLSVLIAALSFLTIS
jgi:hypothetical protein